MDKESIYEFQKIDCNCNDCKFLIRDQARYNKSVEDHRRWQTNYFNTIRDNLYEKAKMWIKRGYPEKAEYVKNEADKMKFQFDKKECLIQYGSCGKDNNIYPLPKNITFIPNTCQLHTQNCFVHRKDNFCNCTEPSLQKRISDTAWECYNCGKEIKV